MGARGSLRTRSNRGRGGLSRRTVALSTLLALIIGGAFWVLLVAIGNLRNSATLTSHSQELLVSADQLEALILDIETGERGYVITGKDRFLEPWYAGRSRFAGRAADFERLATAADSGQEVRASRIVSAARSYIRDYSVPTVTAARRDPASARSVTVTENGKRLVDALRTQFSQLKAVERQILSGRRQRAAMDAQRATLAASLGVGGSVALILGSGGYLSRAVIRPMRRASLMAGDLAEGDLSVRMPETGPGEVGVLERSFNTMAGSLEAGRDELEASRDELRLIATEQSALRTVATLVARGAAPPEVFSAVARETGRLLGVACAAVGRYEPDGAVTVVGAWSAPAGPGHPELRVPVGSRWAPEQASVTALVARTGRPARVSTRQAAGDQLSAWARAQGVTSAIATPVEVETNVWGVMIALSTAPEPPPGDTEERMRAFTDLIATAIANTESRAELAASRARVVTTADETRRRIERDLHDGTQQRLISLGLDLRAAEADLPPGNDGLRARLAHVAAGLARTVEDLQEISRGLHPAILSRGGLEPALRALARRSAVPVELTAQTGRPLPEAAEVAAYYVVSECLTNAAKHARASLVRVELTVDDTLQLSVHDDGVGGADPGRGSGLIGLHDRVEALGGRLQIASPHGGGTTLRVTLPAGQTGPS